MPLAGVFPDASNNQFTIFGSSLAGGSKSNERFHP
jgi:hypothetical protein